MAGRKSDNWQKYVLWCWLCWYTPPVSSFNDESKMALLLARAGFAGCDTCFLHHNEYWHFLWKRSRENVLLEMYKYPQHFSWESSPLPSFFLSSDSILYSFCVSKSTSKLLETALQNRLKSHNLEELFKASQTPLTLLVGQSTTLREKSHDDCYILKSTCRSPCQHRTKLSKEWSHQPVSHFEVGKWDMFACSVSTRGPGDRIERLR